jgi:hypothetical protein
VANTDNSGIATITISSSTPGFATILAQVNNGVSNVRHRVTVYFTTNDILAVTMNLDVASVPDPDGIFNEIDDITLFQNPPPDDTVKVRATVRDAGGVPVGGGVGVTWSTSHTEAIIIRQDTQTSTSGVAEAVVQVTPASIRNTDTLVNVMASANNGAANMVTLFLKPVVISAALSSVTANPSTVNTGETSDVTAVVFLNTGAPAPDGTVVNFTTAPKTGADPSPCGAITPFAATTGGVTDPAATFTAPLSAGTCTVTASTGGVIIGSVDITVITQLALFPASVNVHINATVNFTIVGGIGPYSAFTSDPTNGPITPGTNPLPGNTFSIGPIPAGICTPDPGPPVVPCNATIGVTVVDSTGKTATATINVTNP